DSALIVDMGQVAFSGSAQEVLENEELRHEFLAI
ncbi:MAG: ABC transporter ATP-binding protein, partial [Rhodospirillaceae bacterium]|nr:ABC transporter ATP-binding protein [Rhodospirillaceae bacterium]